MKQYVYCRSAQPIMTHTAKSCCLKRSTVSVLFHLDLNSHLIEIHIVILCEHIVADDDVKPREKHPCMELKISIFNKTLLLCDQGYCGYSASRHTQSKISAAQKWINV